MNGPGKSRNALILLFYALLLVAVAPILIRQIHANDLWKALYSGRYLSLFHQFPHHSTFSYSPVKDLLTRDTFNWFGNLTLLGIHNAVGLYGLQIFRILIAGFAVLLWHSEAKFSRNPLLLLLLILFTYSISQKLRLRTAIFAIPFTLLLLRFWTLYDFGEDKRFLWCLPVVFLVWGNFHGSYVIGFGLFLALVLGRVLEKLFNLRETENSKVMTIGRLLLVTLLIVGTITYSKPFPDYKLTNTFLELPGRMIMGTASNEPQPTSDRTASGSSTHRTDWLQEINRTLQETFAPAKGFRSNEFESPFQNISFAFVRANLVLGAVLLLLLFVSPLPFAYVPMVLATVVLASTFLRAMPYLPLVLGSLVFVLYGQNELPSWVKSPLLQGVSLFLTLILSISLVATASTGLNNLTNQYFHRFGLGKTGKFSDDIPNYVLRNHQKNIVANSYNTGTYLIWKWWPYKRVFVDSKSSAYSNEFWQAIYRVGASRILVANDIHYFVIEANNKNIKGLQKRQNWRLKRARKGLFLFRYHPETPNF